MLCPQGDQIAIAIGGRVVHIVELSNHPEAMRRKARQGHAASGDRARARFEDALTRHRGRVQAARDWRDQARGEHRWWAWLRRTFALLREQRRVPAPPAAATRAADREGILAAGIAGEQTVMAGLGRVLDDSWTLLRGYRNRRGE